jgi:hypothetical protein
MFFIKYMSKMSFILRGPLFDVQRNVIPLQVNGITFRCTFLAY